MPRHHRTPSQRYHDRVAGRYEAMYDDAYWQWHDGLTWEHIRRFLPTDLSSPVIDLGCGSGKWGRKLLKSGYAVTFVDSSARMLDEARRQVADNEGDTRAEFLQADLVDLESLPREHFVLALAMGEPIGCTADPARAIRQIARILRPGGCLIATFDNRVACVDYYLEKGDLDGLERFLQDGRTHWLTRDPAERFDMATFDQPQIERMMIAADLTIVDWMGKTVLPMRNHRALLEDPQIRRRLARIEQRLAGRRENLARCPHLQVVSRK